MIAIFIVRMVRSILGVKRSFTMMVECKKKVGEVAHSPLPLGDENTPHCAEAVGSETRDKGRVRQKRTLASCLTPHCAEAVGGETRGE